MNFSTLRKLFPINPAVTKLEKNWQTQLALKLQNSQSSHYILKQTPVISNFLPFPVTISHVYVQRICSPQTQAPLGLSHYKFMKKTDYLLHID